MKKKKKSGLIWALIAVIAVIAVGAVLIFFRPGQGAAPRAAADMRSATAETGDMTITVSASGALQMAAAEDVAIPEGVELDEVLVEQGDPVRPGNLLATVTADSLRSALADVNDQISTANSRMAQLADASESAYIQAGVGGRVKAIYGAEGQAVSEAALEYGGLLLLSLDGKMAVTLPASDQVAVGDSVTVTRADDSTKTGTVLKNDADGLVVTLTDNGPMLGEEVTVATSDGTALGSGTLSVNAPMMVTGYRGVITDVLVAENDYVYASTSLFELAALGHTQAYEEQLAQRQELADRLAELLQLERDGGILAPFDGTVRSVPDSGLGTNRFTLSPNGDMTVTVEVDELDVLSIQEGQEANVTVAAAGDGSLSGTVAAIDPFGSSVNGVTKYSVKITVPRAEGMLPGMNASVEIVVSRKEGCLLIPEDALNQSGTTTFVYTGYDPETDTYTGETEVTTGLSDGVYVEITAGLTQGATVYYRYAEAETEENAAPWQNMGPWGNFG